MAVQHKQVHTLSCIVPAYGWHFHWCNMGQSVVGTLLGVGPERSMGTDYNDDLRDAYAPFHVYTLAKTLKRAHIFRTRIYFGFDNVFWRKLFTGRNAQLCIGSGPNSSTNARKNSAIPYRQYGPQDCRLSALDLRLLAFLYKSNRQSSA